MTSPEIVEQNSVNGIVTLESRSLKYQWTLYLIEQRVNPHDWLCEIHANNSPVVLTIACDLAAGFPIVKVSRTPQDSVEDESTMRLLEAEEAMLLQSVPWQ